ncbi:hypothetical protein ACFRK5_30735 [Streptomyces niveus]|uniref:hypothetical protein n=1 Tax=Streptomyces niveus TaxID=193462 RepID=UPI0036931954
MDTGLAGLIGALGGGIIGAAGASVAALITFRGARYQADQQRRATHEQWLRQMRREAYGTFLTHADAVRALCRKGLERIYGRLTADELDALASAAEGMQRSASFLALDVAPDLHDKARHLGDRAKWLHLILRVRPEHSQAHERMRRWVDSYETLVEMFSESVQELDRS